MVSLKRQIAFNTIFLSLSKNLQKIFSIFIFFFIINILSVHDYGVLILLLTIPSPVISIITLGLSSLIVSEIARWNGFKDYARIINLFKEYIKFGVILFLIFLFFSWLFKAYLVKHYNIYLAQYYNQIVILLLSQYLLNNILVFLRGFEEFLKISVIEALEPLFKVFFLGLSYFLGKIDVSLILQIYILSKLLSLFIGFLLSYKLFRMIYSNYNRNDQNELFNLIKRVGKWIIFRNILDQFLRNINPWLIKMFLNTQAVAIYGAARRVFSTMTKFAPINSVLFPLISRNIKNKNIISLAIFKARKYYFIFSMFLVIMVWLFSGPIFTKFAPQYIESILLIKIFSLKLLVNALSIGQKGVLFAHYKQKFLFKLFIYSNTQKVLLNVLLLYYFGVIGLTISIIIHSLILTILKEWYINKYIGLLKFKLKDYLTYDKYDKMIINYIVKKLKILKIS